MKVSSATAIYWSATGNSQKVALAVAKAIAKSSGIDLTSFSAKPSKTEFSRDEVVVFSAPVYGGRIPAVAYARLDQFRGDHTPCVVTVTYGNRDYDHALLELYEMAKRNGFVPVSAGAFVGRHTFGEVEVDRPNEADLKEAALLGEESAKRIEAAVSPEDFPALSIKGEHFDEPLSVNHGKFWPTTKPGLCNKCGLCAKLCPVGAIPLEDPSLPADPEKCISCFRCIRNCPHGIRIVDTPEYEQTCERVNEKFRPSRPNELIY